LIQFLMAEFQTPTKSIYQKKGKGIWRRFIHWVPSQAGSILSHGTSCTRSTRPSFRTRTGKSPTSGSPVRCAVGIAPVISVKWTTARLSSGTACTSMSRSARTTTIVA
jgi:hypothetical protein